MPKLIADLAGLPLGFVRSRLGIIAQDPVLLSGTLRLNLDLEGVYSDDQLYDALHQVRLIKRTQPSSAASTSSSETAVDLVENIFTNLETEIKSGGDK